MEETSLDQQHNSVQQEMIQKRFYCYECGIILSIDAKNQLCPVCREKEEQKNLQEQAVMKEKNQKEGRLSQNQHSEPLLP